VVLEQKDTMIDYAISISTFMRNAVYEKRFVVFKECVESLLRTNFEGQIFVVDDGSEIKEHLAWVRTLGDKRLVVVEKQTNGGISRVKNTGLRCIFENGDVNYGFLSDDDMVFKDKDWHMHYMNAIKRTRFEHFIFASHISARPTGHILTVDGQRVLKTILINGCLLTVNRNLINKIGYFRVGPHRYGHEHTQYSMRASEASVHKGYYDIFGSEHLLELNNKSTVAPSSIVTQKEIDANGAVLFEGKGYESCIE